MNKTVATMPLCLSENLNRHQIFFFGCQRFIGFRDKFVGQLLNRFFGTAGFVF